MSDNINNESYDLWANKEYELWSSKVDELINNNDLDDFKNNSAIIRMLGCPVDIGHLFLNKLNYKLNDLPLEEIYECENIGSISKSNYLIDVAGKKMATISLRYIYYADKILENIKENKNNNILEIGGGYGGFCSILHILAKYRNIKINKYSIFDLPNIQKLQKFYLDKIISKSDNGIQEVKFLDSENIENYDQPDTYCISFYAIGEFPQIIQKKYIDNVISKIKNGFILWNSPSGMENDGAFLLRKYHPTIEVSSEDPLTSIKNLQITY